MIPPNKLSLREYIEELRSLLRIRNRQDYDARGPYGKLAEDKRLKLIMEACTVRELLDAAGYQFHLESDDYVGSDACSGIVSLLSILVDDFEFDQVPKPNR